MRKKKPKPVSMRKPRDPEAMRRIRGICLNGLIALVFIAAIGVGFHFVRQYVEQRVVFPTATPVVVLKNRPPWMGDFLAGEIAKTARPSGLHSTFDHQLLVDAAEALRANPWIKEVRQVRRAYGKSPGDTIEIDCEYRAPIALVKWGEYYSLVDGESVKLPEQFTAQQVPKIVLTPDHQTNIRIVEGVKRPPPDAGHKWIGEDLAAGLEVVKLLYGRPYANEVLKVDVSNFDGRHDAREAQVVLVTKYATEVRWGRAPGAKDAFIEVSPAQKLESLGQVFAQYHRIDGSHPWIDIRFDKITYPSTTTGDGSNAQTASSGQ